MSKRSAEELAKMVANAKNVCPPGSTWRHYKGGKYTIENLAILEETLEELVIYRSLEHAEVAFARPLRVWLETVEWNGETLPRFSKIND